MKVCGIIAEYDPFHKGHAWQIEQARKQSKADAVICVMSMSFTQRGMPALLCPHDRAHMALLGGADIVLGVPYAFSVCDAEKFALGGIEILRRTGSVNALSFGIEEAGIDVFEKAAQLLENPSQAYLDALHTGLQQGLPFPRAQGAALAKEMQVTETVFSLPNTSLAVCYARACHKTKADFEFVPVIRKGDYHDAQIHGKQECYASASAVRNAFMQDDFSAMQGAMPREAFEILMRAKNEKRIQRYHPLDGLLRWRLRNDSFEHRPDLSEGIENRFYQAANAQTRDEMVHAVKTKRYPYARINRMFAHVLTQTNAQKLPDVPDYAYVMGFRKSASALVHEISQSELQLYHRLPSADLSYLQELDRRADDLWAIGAGLPFGALHRAKPVILNDL